MGKIRVHFHDVISTHVQCDFEPLTVSRTQTEFTPTMKNVNAPIARSHPISKFSSSVGRLVVNNEDLNIIALGQHLVYEFL